MSLMSIKMDLEQLNTETMDDENILLQEVQEEEHLDQIQSIQMLSNSQEESEGHEGDLHEELEIKKLKTAKKRISLTIEQKIEIIRRHEKGETQRILSQEYKVGRTTVSDILKRKYKFFKFMSMNADKEENLKRRRTLRRTVHKDLEDKLLEWYNDQRALGGYVSGPMISARAQEMHKEMGYTDNFTASNGWLDRFKVRNGIKLCGLREVKTETDINAVAPFKAELSQLADWYNLSEEQIYNADEADLFWKMLPNPESDVNEVKASVRAYRERMTVLCCTNATGTHKLPLVCIGRGKKSRTFTSQEIKTMPVNYFSQETAWMDHDIFQNWFHNYFVPSVRKHLKLRNLPETALLLIDRSPSHPSDQHLRSDQDGAFFCFYFNAKVKTLIQPMEQGIITNMKRHYRRELLTEIIDRSFIISEFQKGLTFKDAIRGIARGWESVTEDTIRRCFSNLTDRGNLHVDTKLLEPSVSIEAFEKLVSQIPECSEYPRERLEKWLNCDEAEPQKDHNLFKSFDGHFMIEKIESEAFDQSEMQEENSEHLEQLKIEGDQREAQEENVVFINLQEPGSTIEIIDASRLVDHTSSMIEQDSYDDLLEDEQEEMLSGHESTNVTQEHLQIENSIVYEENGDITCQQALDALNILLKFMENDADSRYQDVIKLQDLKKKLRQKLNEST